MGLPKPALERWQTWKKHPIAFINDVWPQVQLEAFQSEALEALANHGRVSIRSGHGVGKSSLDAWCVIWFLCTHYPAKVPVTAPTGHQLEDVLQPEIGKWLRMNTWLNDEFLLKADKLVLKSAPGNSFAALRTGNKSNPDALQGFHSDNILFILDEASGIDDIVFEVAEGALSTEGARVLMTGNPTRASGYFWDSFHDSRANWHTMHVPCAESSLPSQKYLDDMSRYGIDSNVYRVRVLGEFPRSDDDAVIPLEWVESAVGRDVDRVRGNVVWGVDVARFGDARTALAKRANNHMLEPIKSWKNKDTMQTAGILLNEYEASEDKPTAIYVDVIGIGAGVVDRMEEMGLPVHGVNVAERPSSKDRFMRYRDELWFAGREWFENMDVKIEDDGELIGELTTVNYEVLSTGKLQVVSKERMRRDGKPSPDLADAFLLTFAASRYEKPKWKPLDYDNRGYV